MAEIKIDIKRIRNANYDIPPMISGLAAQRRYLNMLKWKIPEEIQGRRNIRERLDTVLRELEKAERQLDDVYRITGSAMAQYRDTEKKITANASRFQ
ncbi:MAG: hypothetical protein NC432_07405 [Roseburia sp.]|nr:hypothetical protein [Roseburia sp.]MCM1096832.1 hypothetical protein [Ruminococcus flavefaciens]